MNMSTADMSTANPSLPSSWILPDRGAVGIASFIVAECALFIIFVIGYIFYIGKSVTGPYPDQVLKTPVVATICLLSSSATIVLAERALHKVEIAGFRLWWALTVLLGATFLVQTALDWRELIFTDHFTISSNVFGSTFYGLVGLHATHVTVGLIFLCIVLFSSLAGFPVAAESRRIQFLSWYWHFVDVVWVIVFLVVYVVGK
jgi:cytochrome c oxidase subunit 3